jgi:alpha-glucosidase
LPQADIPFEQLRDPEAIANWPQTFGRDGARTPMPWNSEASNLGFSEAAPWLPSSDAHRPLAVDLQERSEESLLQFTRACIQLRNSSAPLRAGSMTISEAGDQLLVFDRCAAGIQLRCAFNLSDRPIAYVSAGRTVIATGDCREGQLGPYAATIEEID